MKTLKESIFSNIDDIVSNDSALIGQFLKDNYQIDGTYIIKNGVIDVMGDVEVKNKKIESLTNGLFRFGVVSGDFICAYCSKLKSLKGAPMEVGNNFYCYKCDSIKSLEGAPKTITGNFNCTGCESLKTLKGAPEKVSGSFSCSYCEKLTSLKGAPKEVGDGWFYCVNCENLTSLEGAPKETKMICCHGCKNLKFTDQDRKKYKIKEYK